MLCILFSQRAPPFQLSSLNRSVLPCTRYPLTRDANIGHGTEENCLKVEVARSIWSLLQHRLTAYLALVGIAFLIFTPFLPCIRQYAEVPLPCFSLLVFWHGPLRIAQQHSCPFVLDWSPTCCVFAPPARVCWCCACIPASHFTKRW